MNHNQIIKKFTIDFLVILNPDLLNKSCMKCCFHLQEFDHPHILLQNSYSQFKSLVKETDRGIYDQLVKIARQSYIARHGE